MGKYVGIDLGTTYSAIAYLNEHGTPITCMNREGQPVTPSVVMIEPDRTITVGAKAQIAAQTRPDLTAANFKRDMGERFYHKLVGGREFSPEALSALVLRRLRDDFEQQIEPVAGAVITVPAYFGDTRRKATEDAGRIAALNVVDIINEPTAAALANAFLRYLSAGGSTITFEMAVIAASAPSTTLVFDLGGGTFDVTIIRIDGERFNVLATGGEVRLGGVDFDRHLANNLAGDFARHHGVDPRDDHVTAAKLLAGCERAKIELSESPQVAVRLEHQGRHLAVPVTRKRFEELSADLLTRVQLSVELLLEDALLTWDRIDDILLVGGASRMPMIHRMLESLSGKQPQMAMAPDQVVAHGAAIRAAIHQMTEKGGGVAVAVPVRAPVIAPQIEDDDNNPEDILGVFDAPVTEAAKTVKMTDVNSQSLGVIVRSSREEKRIVNSIVVPANTPLPTERTKVFGTEAENQRIVRLRIVEGATRDPRGCTQIGECVIRDLPKGLPQGSPVEVSFRYDKSGRVHVRAVETTSQSRAEVQVERHSGFDQATIDQLTTTVAQLTVE